MTTPTFKIRGQQPAEAGPVVEFWLERGKAGAVFLMANGKIICAVRKCGTLFLPLYAQVPGLQTDEDGRIVVEIEIE